MLLSSDQQQALDLVEQKVIKGNQCIAITGQAGTGKSTIFKAIHELLLESNKAYLLTALTHKAAAIVREVTKSPVSTLHSALSLSPSIDYRTGKQILKRVGAGKAPSIDTLLCIDEASMAGTSLYAAVSPYRTISVGDPYQLSPVGEGLSPLLTCVNHVHLGEVMRHDSEILDLATELCTCVKTGDTPPPMESRGAVEVLSRADFDEEVYLSAEAGEDSVYLSWTNRAALAATKRIRKIALSKDTMYPECGDTMVSNDTLIDLKSGDICIANNEPFTVDSMTPEVTTIDGIRIEGYAAAITSKTDGRKLNVLVATDVGASKRVLSKLRDIALRKRTKLAWADWYAVRHTFADLRFPHAVTVHKSQGSTFGTVFVDTTDIRGNPDGDEYRRLLYVACSRPSTRLVLKR